MPIKTFPPNISVPEGAICPTQTHGTNIVEIITGQEELSDTDGIWTKKSNFTLGVKTADCAPVCFESGDQFGVIHAGWRGLCTGIVENMCELFDMKKTEIWVGPILPAFEIQPDDCYRQVQAKFGDQFFIQKSGKIYFDFKGAIRHLLPMAEFDPRSTYDTLELASWRRDQDSRRNITVINRV